MNRNIPISQLALGDFREVLALLGSFTLAELECCLAVKDRIGTMLSGDESCIKLRQLMVANFGPNWESQTDQVTAVSVGELEALACRTIDYDRVGEIIVFSDVVLGSKQDGSINFIPQERHLPMYDVFAAVKGKTLLGLKDWLDLYEIPPQLIPKEIVEKMKHGCILAPVLFYGPGGLTALSWEMKKGEKFLGWDFLTNASDNNFFISP